MFFCQLCFGQAKACYCTLCSITLNSLMMADVLCASAAINPCETSNGGCSVKAECRRTTPGYRVCVCNAGYTGDGIVCFGKYSLYAYRLSEMETQLDVLMLCQRYLQSAHSVCLCVYIFCIYTVVQLSTNSKKLADFY